MGTTTAQPTFIRSDFIVLGGGAAFVVVAALAHYLHWPAGLAFGVAALAVAMLASLVGRSVEQLGDRFGPGATGVLQSALGNLPELFICLFALKAGLTAVVEAALVGSILANLLLVLGLSFLVGGLKHGTQKLGSEQVRVIVGLMVLSVFAMAVPSLTASLHTRAATHEATFSVVASVVLIAIFLCSLPYSLRRRPDSAAPTHQEQPRWSMPLAVGLLAVAGVLSAFVSDWFVAALEPAMTAAGISQAFAGLVVVAIAGNAIENFVGIQLAARNESEYAFSVILNSPIQIALVLAPVLVLVSQIFGLGAFTLVLSPVLIAVLLLAVLLAAVIALDGESNWLEGAALVGLYVIIATAFWWG